MYRDVLDIFNPRSRFTLTGKYYNERPTSPDDGGEEFNYEYVDPASKNWRTLFANIQVSARQTAIRTDDQLKFKEGQGIVILQDGAAYMIELKMIDYQSAPKQAFRILPAPVGTEYLLRLIAVEEKWGLQ